MIYYNTSKGNQMIKTRENRKFSPVTFKLDLIFQVVLNTTRNCYQWWDYLYSLKNWGMRFLILSDDAFDHLDKMLTKYDDVFQALVEKWQSIWQANWKINNSNTIILWQIQTVNSLNMIIRTYQNNLSLGSLYPAFW